MFVHGTHLTRYDPTIEDSYITRREVDGSFCDFSIMDTAGAEEFAILRRQYMKGADGFLIVYNTRNRRSFDAVEKFYNRIHRAQADRNDIPIVLVGNKAGPQGSQSASSRGDRTCRKVKCRLVRNLSQNKDQRDRSFL
eukprot:TRINITY_DN707_c0_g2_i1.p2 TRINITY_DN707_c0_g2~~TRINITY_DN707_c0_g2_i1.p2  ORF type:complete len:138 (+),score=8.12 TRINITY_DN707_c0_g2_i1:1007-1420(+)